MTDTTILADLIVKLKEQQKDSIFEFHKLINGVDTGDIILTAETGYSWGRNLNEPEYGLWIIDFNNIKTPELGLNTFFGYSCFLQDTSGARKKLTKNFLRDPNFSPNDYSIGLIAHDPIVFTFTRSYDLVKIGTCDISEVHTSTKDDLLNLAKLDSTLSKIISPNNDHVLPQLKHIAEDYGEQTSLIAHFTERISQHLVDNSTKEVIKELYPSGELGYIKFKRIDYYDVTVQGTGLINKFSLDTTKSYIALISHVLRPVYGDESIIFSLFKSFNDFVGIVEIRYAVASKAMLGEIIDSFISLTRLNETETAEFLINTPDERKKLIKQKLLKSDFD